MAERMTLEEMLHRLIPQLVNHINHSIVGHGGLPKSIERAALIVSEEAGELAQATLDATRNRTITEAEYHHLENRIIEEQRDVMAAAFIYLMVHIGAQPVLDSVMTDFEIPDGQKVM